jgi:hypothetical protein
VPDETGYVTASDHGGNIYVGTNQSRVYKFDSRGVQRWVFSFPGRKTNCIPGVGPDGSVCVVAADHTVYRIDAAGNEVWHAQVSQAIAYPAPLLSNANTYVGDSHFGVIALSKDGKEVWRTGDHLIDGLSPALFAEGLVGCVRPDDGKVNTFNADGSLAWSFSYTPHPENDEGYKPAAVHTDGCLYLSGFSGTGYQVLALNSRGKELWRADCGQTGGKLCLSATGDLWIITSNEMAAATAQSTAPERILVIDSNGQRVCDFPVPFKDAVSRPEPLADGSMLVIGNEGTLYCFKR